MQKRYAFSDYHPTINFLYFALVLSCAMFLMHPVYLALSFATALAYSLHLRGRKAVRFSLAVVLPMMLIAAIVNPAFSHEGATILSYLPSGNPLTLESIAYGLAAAAMLASVILWFTCFNEVITSDKFVYLFGKVSPALSLVLSMTFRFVPKFTAQFKETLHAQRCIGRDISDGPLLSRMRVGITVLSIMVTRSLEGSIDTADSMKSRGYGLPGRTAFSIYRFGNRDRKALAWIVFCGAYIFAGWTAGAMSFRYYPTLKAAAWNAHAMSTAIVYAMLCLTPVILDIWQDKRWESIARVSNNCANGSGK